jgi:hypothetical protein
MTEDEENYLLAVRGAARDRAKATVEANELKLECQRNLELRLVARFGDTTPSKFGRAIAEWLSQPQVLQAA